MLNMVTLFHNWFMFKQVIIRFFEESVLRMIDSEKSDFMVVLIPSTEAVTGGVL